MVFRRCSDAEKNPDINCAKDAIKIFEYVMDSYTAMCFKNYIIKLLSIVSKVCDFFERTIESNVSLLIYSSAQKVTRFDVFMCIDIHAAL